MADRTLLHQNKLEMLKWWLSSIGYEIKPTKGDFEVLRAKKDNDTIIIFKKISAKEHLTIQSKDYKLIRQFVKQRVEIKRKWKEECEKNERLD